MDEQTANAIRELYDVAKESGAHDNAMSENTLFMVQRAQEETSPSVDTKGSEQ